MTNNICINIHLTKNKSIPDQPGLIVTHHFTFYFQYNVIAFSLHMQLFFFFLTFKESKQAITLPFSTWQLLGGCANLHSSSEREQVPL